MQFKLKLKGDREPLTIEGISDVTGISKLKVLDMIENRKSDLINIGFITDIEVKEELEHIEIKKRKELKPKVSHKAPRVGRTSLYDNCIDKDSPIDPKHKHKHTFIVDGKKHTATELTTFLNVGYQALIRNAAKYKYIEYEGTPITIETVRGNPYIYSYTEDGITIHKNKRIKDLADELGFKSSTVEARVSTKDNKMGFYLKNNLVFSKSLEEAINHVRYYGFDGTRYYFGPLYAIAKALNINAPIHTLKQHFYKHNLYDFAGIKIVRNEKG